MVNKPRKAKWKKEFIGAQQAATRPIRPTKAPAHDGPISLREWLVHNEITQIEFARRMSRRLYDMGEKTKVTQQRVLAWLGKSTPTLEMIALIIEETGGELSYESFHMQTKYDGDVRLVEAGLLDGRLLANWRK